MNAPRFENRAIICLALLVTIALGTPAPARQISLSLKSAQSRPAATPRESRQIFTEPVLVKGSPTNLASFDVSWNDNSTQRYYFADRTNDAIDLVDSATDTFLGFIGKGHFTGARVCPGTRDARHCAGPNGVVTDDLGHVWSGDGEGNITQFQKLKATFEGDEL